MTTLPIFYVLENFVNFKFMNVSIPVILFVISLSLCKAKKGKKITSNASESSAGDSDGGSGLKDLESLEDAVTFNTKYELKMTGTLRQLFALETAFQDPSHNMICSPVSGLLPLGKLALGAENDSRAELYEMIGVSDDIELSSSIKKLIHDLKYIPGVKLTVASRLYVSDKAKLKSKFTKASHKIFDSDVQKISFLHPKSAADEINGWVSRETNGKIPLLLNPEQISPASSLIIVNAIYFNGAWMAPFRNVEVGDFFSPTGQKKVQLMSRQGRYRYVKSDILNAQIVEIPYQGFAASLMVVLPQTKHGLPLLLNQLKLAPNLLNDALNKIESRMVQLTIPKFQITTTLDLKDLYEKIGMKIVTSKKSGLKKIVEHQELLISSAVQKAVIEVHERGTEAAAASATHLLEGAGVIEPPVMFQANHPFLFFLQANREQLFAGIYSEP